MKLSSPPPPPPCQITAPAEYGNAFYLVAKYINVRFPTRCLSAFYHSCGSGVWVEAGVSPSGIQNICDINSRIKQNLFFSSESLILPPFVNLKCAKSVILKTLRSICIVALCGPAFSCFVL